MLKERTIDRPITLHKGQLRGEAGYALATITKGFDRSGQSYDLKSSGTSFARHHFHLGIRYGILQNLTIEAYTDHKSQTVRREQIVTLSATQGIVEVSEIETRNGFDNLNVMLVGRAPLRSRRIDVIGSAGFGIRLGKDEEQKPDHRYSSDGNGATTLDFRFRKKWGSGTNLLQIGTQVKYRWPTIAFTGGLHYVLPLATATYVQWEYQLMNQVFQYKNEDCLRQNPSMVRCGAELEYQIAPWFDLSLLLMSESLSHGWIEARGQRYKVSPSYLLTLGPGYEIIVTPKVWLRQRINFSLFGESGEAPFAIYTSLVFNEFPILKR